MGNDQCPLFVHNFAYFSFFFSNVIYEKINSSQQLILSNIQRIGFTIYYYLHKMNKLR